MLKKRLIGVVPLLAVAAAMFGVATPSASATVVTNVTETKNLLAIYGNPANNGEVVPVGGGLGRNFGFGENILFCASTTHCKSSENLSINLGGAVLLAGETWIGGTLMSNKTPNVTIKEVVHQSPVSFAIQFVDFQENKVNTASAPAYADTFDRPWITEICGKEASCNVDAREGGAGAHLVEIQDVSFSVNAPTEPIVVQGTVWGEWVNSTKLGEPSCIKLREPPEKLKVDTLVETQGPAVGTLAKEPTGKACIVSANNDYTEAKLNQITIE